MFNGINFLKFDYIKFPMEFFTKFSTMSGSQLKVIMYILKHTIGCGNNEPIKLTINEIQFGRYDGKGGRIDDGTGLSTGIISKCLKNAIEEGLLVCFVDNEDKLHIKKYYTIRQNPHIQGVTYKYDEIRGNTDFDIWQNMTSADYTSVENIDKDFAPNSNIIKEGGSADTEILINGSLSKIENNKIISDQNDMIDNKIYKSINHINDMMYAEIEKPKKYCDKKTLQEKYNLTDDEMKICLSKMRGKDIKYPSRFLEKVIQNYIKDKDILKDAARTNAAPKNYYNSYPQRKYNIDELEKKLLEASRNKF